jgi:peptidoglycan endopeptidase LytE
MMAFDAPDTASYEPVFPFCNTYECDQRVLSIRHRRKVQARHKAAVRAAKHNAKRLRVIAPYRAWLASTRSCESPTGRDSASGQYHGYYQFDLQSWRGAGGKGMPCEASLLEQSYRAVIWLKMSGRGAWPVCG